MELQGKVIAVLPARSGVSARGEWKSQSFVIETHDSFPRKMVFDVFGEERLTRFNIQLGQEVNVSFDIDAHEYNGRWFNNIRAFDVRLVDPNTVSAAPAAQAAPAAPQQPANAPFPPQPEQSNSDDDLPF
ncbi:putative uncharacterized protein [Prevotella sp. CAG:474]|jgi:single-stranded DNA-binding protein|uniref:DUF3127 domain-containing protein n=1 Tax=Prevotella TaxID=838 RepID=UPI00033B6F32|nr:MULTISPECIES: DUF3127 domain-containing protein [Prevotella]CDC98671.1 putative uncharacterized protein [Prevotella sp. CAG:474]MCF2638111.1 DUF3127 domain-containing protein [Prevotella dentalis]OYP66899.1 DUF3127 domain-containing protein [Prevotella sp. P5-108]OYP67525.1 DUF3127 domain-containing protein [Prevotella sp. P5-64]OYP75469.1 DUF3127 domain-containing protein [Prevotella sp. P4-67]